MTSDRVDVGRVAIGQGDLFATPLQMAIGRADDRQRRRPPEAAHHGQGRRSRRPDRRRGRARGGASSVMSRQDGARPDGDDEERGARGDRHRGGARGRRGRRQDRHRRAQHHRAQPAVVHVLHARRGGRDHARALPGRHRRDRRRADRQAACSRRWGSRRCRRSRPTPWSTAATGSSAGSAPAGWPTSTRRRTPSSAGGSRSSCSTAASPRTPSSSSASAARRRAPPALNHPNVVQVFDRGEWDGTYYIAMELLEGRNLKDIVREHGALEPALAVDIVLQILQRGAVRAPARRRPPRHQAAQRDRRRRGPREGHRLRDRPRRQRRT